MSREEVFHALLLEFVSEQSLPPRAVLDSRIRRAIKRGLTPRQFVDEFLDTFVEPAPAPGTKWLH